MNDYDRVIGHTRVEAVAGILAGRPRHRGLAVAEIYERLGCTARQSEIVAALKLLLVDGRVKRHDLEEGGCTVPIFYGADTDPPTETRPCDASKRRAITTRPPRVAAPLRGHNHDGLHAEHRRLLPGRWQQPEQGDSLHQPAHAAD